LAKDAKEMAKFARSANTNKAYTSDWLDFSFWCESKGLSALPALPQTIGVYLISRVRSEWVDYKGKLQKPLKAASLRRRLTAISQAHLLANHPIDLKHPDIREVWKGIRNKMGTAQTGKDPILLEDLQQMIKAISLNEEKKNPLLGIRDRAILLIGFAGAFRRSEIVSLTIEDIKFVREGLIANLRKTKTDQEGKGRLVAIPYGSNILTCPVRTLQEWLEASKIEKGPLFRYVNRHGQLTEKALSSHSIAKIIKRNAHIKNNIDLANANKNRVLDYSGHSLRAGFATQAAMAGLPEYMIAKQTGHKSNVIKKYIRIGNMWTENAATKIGL
jgi:integrase